MNKKLLPYLILICALGLSATAAYYSIIGLSLLFAGVALPVIIMGTFLEISKLTIATLLHSYWKDLKNLMKIYLTIAVIILSFITSIGIYGLLSSGYKVTEMKDTNTQNQINLISSNIETYTQNKKDLKEELKQNNKDGTQLRIALGNNTQSKVDRNGNLIVSSSKENRKAFQEQLDIINKNGEELTNKIQKLDSIILKTTQEKLLLESNSETAAELGPLTYISELVNKDRGTIINWLILCIIFVFDPLAISLIVAANFSFNMNRKHPEIKEYNVYNPEPINENITIQKEENTIEPTIENEQPIQTRDTSEEDSIRQQIKEISESNVASRNKHVAISQLQNMLDNIRKDDENTITY
jgi:type II secretory pathway pseudopilin PulG